MQRARADAKLSRGWAAALLLLLGWGCIVAEPPMDFPRVPARRPIIIRASVVPSASAVMSTWPRSFLVPVEVSNPSEPVEWAVYVDYDPATGTGYENSDISAGSAENGSSIRVLEIPIAEPAGDRSCHVVEVVVGRSLNRASVQTIRSGDIDLVSWFFNPAGDLAGCPVADVTPFDAGVGADAGADAP